MRLPGLYTLIALSATFSTVAAQLIPGAVPQFEALFVGQLLIGESSALSGPFGTRLHIQASG